MIVINPPRPAPFDGRDLHAAANDRVGNDIEFMHLKGKNSVITADRNSICRLQLQEELVRIDSH